MYLTYEAYFPQAYPKHNLECVMLSVMQSKYNAGMQLVKNENSCLFETTLNKATEVREELYVF